MKRKIIDYEQDAENHWVAILDCGHRQHVRHNPPLVSRPWVTSKQGRNRMLGYALNCKLCDRE